MSWGEAVAYDITADRKAIARDIDGLPVLHPQNDLVAFRINDKRCEQFRCNHAAGRHEHDNFRGGNRR